MFEGLKLLLSEAWNYSAAGVINEFFIYNPLYDEKSTTIQIQKHHAPDVEGTPRVVGKSKNPFAQESIAKLTK